MTSFRTRWMLSIFLTLLFTNHLAVADTRIVSAGGSVTEVLFALGLGEQVVAVDTSSLYPEQVLALPKIGYYRQLSPEGVLSQRPDVLVGHNNMGPANVLTQISQTGVEVFNIPHAYSLDSLYGLISSLATRFERVAEGQALVSRIQNQIDATKPKLKTPLYSAAFLVSVGERGLMAAGVETMPDVLFSLAGVNNAFAELSGYQPVSVEVLLSSSPDWLLVPSHAAAGQSAAQLCQLPSLKFWAAKQGCNIEVVDPLIFMGLSPRLAQGVALLTALSSHEEGAYESRHVAP